MKSFELAHLMHPLTMLKPDPQDGEFKCSAPFKLPHVIFN